MTVHVNYPPKAVADLYDCVNVGSTFNAPNTEKGGVLSNDTDADGGTLTAVLVAGPAHGTLTLNSNGSFTYLVNAAWAASAPAGSHPTDSFTYKANDGLNDSNVVTVTLTINRTPVAAANAYTALMNVDNFTANVLSNDTDPDGTLASEGVVVTPVTQTGAYGTVTILANGTLTLTNADSDYRGTFTVNYTITDHCGLTSTAVVTITITSNAKTQGYWSTHAMELQQLLNANSASPGVTTVGVVSYLKLAGASYTGAELSAIMKLSCGTGSSANAILIEFQQLAAAMINTLPVTIQTGTVTLGGVTASTNVGTAITNGQNLIKQACINQTGFATNSKLKITAKNTIAWSNGTIALVSNKDALWAPMIAVNVTLTGFNQTGT